MKYILTREIEAYRENLIQLNYGVSRAGRGSSLFFHKGNILFTWQTVFTNEALTNKP
jgi:hypothetical protein